LYDQTQATKHKEKSEVNLSEGNMYEGRRRFSVDAPYQTHPKSFYVKQLWPNGRQSLLIKAGVPSQSAISLVSNKLKMYIDLPLLVKLFSKKNLK
jgi:hypothetical protein